MRCLKTAPFVYLGLMATLAAAPQSPSQTPPGSGGFAERDPRYRVQPNDVIEIQFRLTPEFNFTATIQPDGFVSSQITGDLRVAGMTIPEISQAVAKKTSDRLNNPEVGVVLRDFVKPHFVVSGEVAKPGTYELRGNVGLIQAIAMSGGFVNTSAKRTQVILLRRVDSDYVKVNVFDLNKLTSPGKVREDVFLRPDDMLVVPRNALSKIEPYLRLSSLGIWGLTMGIP
jgi:polysaccharide export outer membrane protein